VHRLYKVDARLAEWMKAYERLKEAQSRYKAPLLNRETSQQVREEVDRLQREAETALSDLQVAFDEAKRRSLNPGSSSS
jgi:hypothetical protein